MKAFTGRSSVSHIAFTVVALLAMAMVSCAGSGEGELFDETLKASMDEQMNEATEDVEEIVAGGGSDDFDLDEMLTQDPAAPEGGENIAEERETAGDALDTLFAETPATEEAIPVAAAEDTSITTDDLLAAPAGLDPVASMDFAPIPMDIPAAVEEAPAPKPRRRAAARVPEISTDAINEGGKLLNRYYFVRKSDTPEKVSELIYGTADRVADLLASAGGAPSWEPGTPVYYTSPDQPSDPKMRSFYYERTVKPDTYTVQKGDTLGAIAVKTYGDRRSWKEIAIINQLKSPTELEEGQLLALAPPTLGDYAKNNWVVAKQFEVSESDSAKVASTALSDLEKAQAKAEFNSEMERNQGDQQAAVGIGGFIRQNWLFLGVLVTFGVATLFLFVVLPKRNTF